MTVVGGKFAIGRGVLSSCWRTDELGGAKERLASSLDTVMSDTRKAAPRQLYVT